MRKKQSRARRFPGWIAPSVAMIVAAAVSTACAGIPAPGPDAAPEQIPPTSDAHTGTCYTVAISGWDAAAAARAPHLANFELPSVVYLHPERDHEDMEGGVDTGNRDLLWRDAKEARWISDGEYPSTPWAFGHAHWWQTEDARYHVGFAGGGDFWVGFEALPSTEGMTGVFRYFSDDALGETAEPELEVGARLVTVDCLDTPLVIFE